MDKTVIHPESWGVRPGTRLNGTYEIERLIAEGGMGEVYQGFNIETGDPVAIKMIRPEFSRNADALALFRREASILHNLQHEAIVRYFGFSVDPDLRRAYLAMEFVDGPSLATRLTQGPLSLEEVGIFFGRIAPALDEAHRLDIIHRDISPDNFILPDGDVRRAKLIDFGIARSNRPNEGTIIGDGVAGKYNYISPEQLGLAGGDVTGKSDVYSFGLVLAEALSGRPIGMGGTQVEIIEKRRKVPDLSAVPPAFRQLLESMLRPNPAERPAVLSSLGGFGASRRAPAPIVSKPAGAGRGIMVAVAAMLIVATLGAVGYFYRDAATSWWQRVPPKPTETVTVKPKTPPPLPIATPTASSEPTPIAKSCHSASSANLRPSPPTPEPSPTAARTPGLDDLLDELPPRPPQASVSLPPATVGTPYKASMPAFSDPGHQGLTLNAETPPDGLTFLDCSDGSSELSGVPTKPGAATFVVTATNHKGRSANMSASIAIVAVAATPPTSTPTVPSSPPVPSQAEVRLDDAIAGRDYNANFPPFRAGTDPNLVLHPEPSPPDGLTFVDAGGGFSQLSGKPARPGAYDFDVVATDATGASGRMVVKLIVAPSRPPAPSRAVVTLDDAVAGHDYDATLPPFQAGTDPSIALHPEPNPPDGLALVDSGGGFGRLAGKPARPGAYEFEVVATDGKGASGRMTVKLVVAPPPKTDKAQALLANYSDGACFFARQLGANEGGAIEAVSSDRNAFSRFEAAFKRDVGVEPNILPKVIVAPECPAVSMMKLSARDAATAPKIALAWSDVGAAHPLAGVVRGLAGRRLALLLIDNDGDAYLLPSVVASSGDTAEFSFPISGDADSIGRLQTLLAIVSDTPFSVFDHYDNDRAKPVSELSPLLRADWSKVGAVADVAFVKLIK